MANYNGTEELLATISHVGLVGQVVRIVVDVNLGNAKITKLTPAIERTFKSVKGRLYYELKDDAGNTVSMGTIALPGTPP